MKCSEAWLREWANPKLNRDKLCHQMTMAGFEVEQVIPASELGSELKGHVIDFSITPNRGDCLSIRGMSREISAVTKVPLKSIKVKPIKAIVKDKLPISIKATSACPRYVGRVIRHVNADANTPGWMKDRLLSAGLNLICPLVDIANYVMLELGQPMHAFDLNTIERGIEVRLSKQGETIALLDGSEKVLDADTLVIADKKRPLAIAGVMGGLDSCVTLETTDILLESAYFSPMVVARQRQHYGLNTDSAYRFERNIDSTMQREAIERATQLVLDIAGGEAGPIIEIANKTQLPKPRSISLTPEKIQAVLGVAIPAKQVEAIFKRLTFACKKKAQQWIVTVPPYRHDLSIPEDLVEEVARLYGYDHIPTKDLSATLGIKQPEFNAPNPQPIRECLADFGYHEIISYSFVREDLQVLLEPNIKPIALANPITSEMTVMRTSLWPGLINAFHYNKSRQQDRIRLIELGCCFRREKGKLIQENRIAGLISGPALPEQWGLPTKTSDFFDLKGDLERLFAKGVPSMTGAFLPATHAALHPGQTAGIFIKNKQIGLMGALHPQVARQLDIVDKVYLFELDLDSLLRPAQIRCEEISKYPSIRRDIAIVINETIPADKIQATIRDAAGGWLKDVFVFDVYQGKGVTPGCKSLAFGMILQHPTRTLVDEEAIQLVERVVTALKGQYGAELRS